MTPAHNADTTSPLRRWLHTFARWQLRSSSIRELRAMPEWRLADLGLTRSQIPAFVDALLDSRGDKQGTVAPTEVCTGLTRSLTGPWADGLGDAA